RRDEVLQAALALLDEVGLDRLTVRRLAERLDVRPSALYRHYPNKRALLDAMVEHIAADGMPQPPVGDWQAQVHVIAASARASMLAPRAGARLLATFVVPGPAMVSSFQLFVDLFRSVGASSELAERSVDTIVCYVSGFTIEEQTRGAVAQGSARRLEKDRAFHAGLELIISGIRAALADQSSAG